MQEEGEHHHQQQQQVDVPLAIVDDVNINPDEENDAVENEEENIQEADQVREENQ